jgi:hypothetical protein
VLQFLRLEVKFPVLVVDFELRAFCFQQRSFGRIQLCQGLKPMRAVVVGTLVEGDVLLCFPAKERQSAVGTEEL